MKKTLKEITEQHKEELAKILGHSDCNYFEADSDHFRFDYLGSRDCHVYLAYEDMPYKAADYLRSLNYDIPNQYPSQPERVEGVDWEAVGDYLDASWGKANRDYLIKELQHRFFTAAPSAVDWSEVRSMLTGIAMDNVSVDDVLFYLKNHFKQIGGQQGYSVDLDDLDNEATEYANLHTTDRPDLEGFTWFNKFMEYYKRHLK